MPREVHARTTVKSNLSLRNRTKRHGAPRPPLTSAVWVNKYHVRASTNKNASKVRLAKLVVSNRFIRSIERDLAARAVGLTSDSSAFVVGVSLFRSAGLWS